LYSISSGTTVLPPPVYIPKQPLVFKSPVHYDAFFCRMEQHSADRLKVWVKIHAGDYDRYGKERMVREELRIKN
jgi:hypothetical protein